MRCKCCNSMEAKLWDGDYYCKVCKNVVSETLIDYAEKDLRREPMHDTQNFDVHEYVVDSEFDDDDLVESFVYREEDEDE